MWSLEYSSFFRLHRGWVVLTEEGLLACWDYHPFAPSTNSGCTRKHLPSNASVLCNRFYHIDASMDDLLSSCFTTLSGVVAVFTLVATIVIYRRYFSPLRGIPGPFLASFSRLWHLQITVQGNQNEQLVEAHEKYGHFVRLANNEVSVSHPDAIRKVLLTPLEKVSFHQFSPGAC